MDNCHIVILPLLTYGHMIPLADMAVLFAARGLKTTIFTTPSYAPFYSKSIKKTITYNHQIALHIIEFKEEEAGLLATSENPDQAHSLELTPKFFQAISMFQEPVEHFIREFHPDCIIADMLYSWATKVAAKFNIPRVVFKVHGFFSDCAADALRLHGPARNVSSDSEPFIIPHLPHEIKIAKKQLHKFESGTYKDFIKVMRQAIEADVKSYGVIVNTFYELEPKYAYYYREVMKRKTWHIGPVSLCNKSIEDSSERGKKTTIDEHKCLKWLESKAPDSVIYVSFGTMVNITRSQVYEIAMGLEASNKDFIWVINKEHEQSMPEGFTERTTANEKGLIIKGWAPQVLILNHESVGGFMTHCGWNSLMEGVCGGVAMVTWPMRAEQFYNEKLVTQVLRIGISIGDVEWTVNSICDGVKREAIEEAVERVMGVEEGEELRMRAQVLKEKARAAVEEGGSSYSDLDAFIHDIKEFKNIVTVT